MPGSRPSTARWRNRKRESRLHGAAEEGLEAIGDWIAQDNPARALTFVRELRGACLDIGPRPMAYPLVEHRKGDRIRRKVHRNYLIFYRVEDGIVEIVHVLHGAPDYAPLLFGDNDDI